MNILVSAYSVSPFSGSESGVAWSFIKELAKNHTLFIITRTRNKPDLEKVIPSLDFKDKLFFFYLDIPFFSKRYKVAGITEHIYYFFWQIAIVFKARNIIRNHPIDLIHHITLGAFRYPSLLTFFDKPFIFGPIGGGENYPFTIKKSFPVKFILVELFRDLVNKLFLLNPLLLYTFSRSTLIVCRTRQTLDLIPKRFHHKCIIEIGICIPDFSGNTQVSPGLDPEAAHVPLKILYAGRPLYWKGLHFVIQAYSQALQQYPDMEFNVSGPGDNEWARGVAARHGVHDKINWLGKIDRPALEQLYRTSDLLAFPSLREAGGAVALEALSFSLPVLCLDLGGPCQIVNQEWGIVVNTRNKTQADLVRDIAGNMIGLYGFPDKLKQMKANAAKEAGKYSMSRIVDTIYHNPLIREALEHKK